VEICAVIQFAWENLVAAPVSRKKYDLAATDAARDKLIRRFAERRRHRHPSLPLDSFHLVQAAAADDADLHAQPITEVVCATQARTSRRKPCACLAAAMVSRVQPSDGRNSHVYREASVAGERRPDLVGC